MFYIVAQCFKKVKLFDFSFGYATWELKQPKALELAKNTLLCYYFSAMLTTNKKQNIIKKNQLHEKDTGSPEVQVAILSKRIEELASHLKDHKKDNSSRRGLIKMVADRRNHLKSLEKTDKERYQAVAKKMKE